MLRRVLKRDPVLAGSIRSLPRAVFVCFCSVGAPGSRAVHRLLTALVVPRATSGLLHRAHPEGGEMNRANCHRRRTPGRPCPRRRAGISIVYLVLFFLVLAGFISLAVDMGRSRLTR